MFFKRLSNRSRSNSQSYVDHYQSPHDSKTNSASYDDKYSPSADDKFGSLDGGSGQDATNLRPASSQQSQHAAQAPQPLDSADTMYSRQNQPTEVGLGRGNQHQSYSSPPVSAGARGSGGISNGYGGAERGGYDSGASPTFKHEPPPDLLMQAFNQALRPYTEKTDALESEIADLRAYIEQLEAQRSDVHAWIDKRGLRPDVPPSIGRQMDTASHSTSATHAASTLNAQLDRKITIVNFDLHRLQDDLNDSLPTPSFSACMLKFLPDISRLSALPSGPRHAFDLLLKLGGNLNSHGGLESGDEEDLAERAAFYRRLDDSMVEVVQGRFREEGDAWGVQREIKRIEKTGAYLRNWGVEPYFPRTLDVMRNGQAQGPNHALGQGSQAVAGGSASPGGM